MRPGSAARCRARPAGRGAPRPATSPARCSARSRAPGAVPAPSGCPAPRAAGRRNHEKRPPLPIRDASTIDSMSLDCRLSRHAREPARGSLGPQRRGRVDPYRSPCGHDTGAQRRHDEKRRSTDQQDRIPDDGTEELRKLGDQGGQDTRDDKRSRDSEERTCNDQKRAFPEDDSQHVRASRAQRQSDPDLVAPTGDGVGRNPVKPITASTRPNTL